MWKEIKCVDGKKLYKFYIHKGRAIANVKHEPLSAFSVPFQDRWRIDIYYGNGKTMGDSYYENDLEIAKFKALLLAKEIGWKIKTLI